MNICILRFFYVPLRDFLMLNKYLNKNEKDFIIRSYVD